MRTEYIKKTYKTIKATINRFDNPASLFVSGLKPLLLETSVDICTETNVLTGEVKKVRWNKVSRVVSDEKGNPLLQDGKVIYYKNRKPSKVKQMQIPTTKPEICAIKYKDKWYQIKEKNEKDKTCTIELKNGKEVKIKTAFEFGLICEDETN